MRAIFVGIMIGAMLLFIFAPPHSPKEPEIVGSVVSFYSGGKLIDRYIVRHHFERSRTHDDVVWFDHNGTKIYIHGDVKVVQYTDLASFVSIEEYHE